jgi:hypothetical protein
MEINATHTPPATLDTRVVGTASVIVMLISLAFANFTGTGEGGAGPYLITGGFSVLVAAAVFGWAVPRARRNGTEMRTALVLTGLALIGLPVFWSGLTQVTAPGAAMLAIAAAPRRGLRVLLGIATVAYLAAVVACVIG